MEVLIFAALTHMYTYLLDLHLNGTLKALTSACILFGLLYPQGQPYVELEP